MQFIETGRGRSVLVFKRQSAGDSVIVALNLDSRPAKIRIPAAGAQLQTILGGDSLPDQNGDMTLAAWGYRVWSNKR